MHTQPSNLEAPQTGRNPQPPVSRPLLGLLLLLAGCGGTTTRSTSPTSGYPGSAISGDALAGAKPLGSSAVQLYAAGTSGNGSSPTALAAATSDSTGAFTIAAGYTCPTSASELYLVARGGSVSPAPANSGIALAVPLGRCDSIASTTRFTLNEATTAASAWALSQFLSPGGNLGASATNASGLSNAVASSIALTGNATGLSPGPTYPANASSPAPRINTLANLLNSCAASSAGCPQLFALTGNATNTLDAALSLVRNPGLNVLALFNLASTSTAFSPALPSSPADWTLPLTFTGAGMNAPGPLAVDSNGNVWVASYNGVASRFSPIGEPGFPSGITGLGLSQSYGLAIDLSDNVWITDENSPTSNGNLGAVTVLTSAGQPLSGSAGFSSGGINYPVAIAIDPNGTAWTVDYGNSHLTLLSSTGAPLSGASGYFSTLFAFPVAIALDAAHNAWIANQGSDSSAAYNVTRVSPDGESFLQVNCCNTPSGLAIDQAGNIWVANMGGSSVSQISPTGNVLSTGYTGGGLLHPQGIAIDGAGNVWVANFYGNSISELAGSTSPHPGQALSPAIGWAPTPASLHSFAIAVDSSGNLWISNFAADSITKITGLATPVKTPLSALPQLP